MSVNNDNESARGDDARTIAWRVRNLERAVHTLETEQDLMRKDHESLAGLVRQARDQLSTIVYVSGGTFIVVVGGLVLEWVIGVKH